MPVYCSCAGDFALTIHTQVGAGACSSPHLLPLVGPGVTVSCVAGLHGAGWHLPKHCPVLQHATPQGDPGVAAAEEPSARPLASPGPRYHVLADTLCFQCCPTDHLTFSLLEK